MMPSTAEGEDISIFEMFAEMIKFYGFSHGELLSMPWLSFCGYLRERNNIVSREIKEMKKATKR
ncbi:MAG: hypothetical protein QME49_04875 [bacterium]|nr:hypothetical protein [bacterium]